MTLDKIQLCTACRLFNEGYPESEETSQRVLSILAHYCDNFGEVVALAKSRPRHPIGEVRFDAQAKRWIIIGFVE